MDEPKLETNLELHALRDGGYVVREGCFNNDEDYRYMVRCERAAFSTLPEAIVWLGKHMQVKAP